MLINEVLQQIETLRSDLKTFIESIPDTIQGVKLISKKPYCAIVKFSQLENNWTPEYYINSTVKGELLRIVSICDIRKLKERLEKIIENGKILIIKSCYVNGYYRGQQLAKHQYYIPLNKMIAEKIKHILEKF